MDCLKAVPFRTKDVPQGLKALIFPPFTARLKSGPDTKPKTKISRRLYPSG
jgi:hypothetical protein